MTARQEKGHHAPPRAPLTGTQRAKWGVTPGPYSGHGQRPIGRNDFGRNLLNVSAGLRRSGQTAKRLWPKLESCKSMILKANPFRPTAYIRIRVLAGSQARPMGRRAPCATDRGDTVGKSSRDKGKRGERELAKLWQEALPHLHVRRTGQDQAHQAEQKPGDIDAGPDWCVEGKRRKRLSWTVIREGLEQAEQAASEGQTPVLCAREDHGRWIAVVDLEVFLGLVGDLEGAKGTEEELHALGFQFVAQGKALKAEDALRILRGGKR